MIKKYFLPVFFLAFGLFSCQDESSLEGDRFFHNGQYQEAIQAYNDFLKYKPRHLKTIYNRGRSYQELGEFDKAMEDFTMVVRLDPKNENALLSMGQEMYRTGDYKSVNYYCEKVLEFNKNSSMAFFMRARSNHKLGFGRDALTDYNAAISISPNFGEAYFHRGALYLLMNKRDAACKDLRKAASLNVEGAEEALKKTCG